MINEKTDSYNFWCKHNWQIIDPKKRLEQCIHCKKIRSFPYYPYSFAEEIEVEKLKKKYPPYKLVESVKFTKDLDLEIKILWSGRVQPVGKDSMIRSFLNWLKRK